MQTRFQPARGPDAAPIDDERTPLDLLLDRRRLLVGTAGLAIGAFGGVQQTVARRLDDDVDLILAGMSLRERIAQLFIFHAAGTKMTAAFERSLDDIRPGGIIFAQSNIGTNKEIRRFATKIHRSNEALPPLIAVDQEGGEVVRLPGDPAPGALELGRMADRRVRAKAKQRARFVDDFGFDINFAPVADVAYERTSVMALRSFGDDPRKVARKVAVTVRGSHDGRILAAAKHFPGHGRTAVDSHHAIPEVHLSWKAWRHTDGRPFRAAVDAGVDLVMVGHLRYPKWDDAPMSLSKVAVRALRKELGFQGVIVTDDLGMGALAGVDPIAVLDRATAAGVDVFLHPAPPADWREMIDHLVRRVRNDKVSDKRITASVRRVVALKVRRFGLHPQERD